MLTSVLYVKSSEGQRRRCGISPGSILHFHLHNAKKYTNLELCSDLWIKVTWLKNYSVSPLLHEDLIAVKATYICALEGIYLQHAFGP